MTFYDEVKIWDHFAVTSHCQGRDNAADWEDLGPLCSDIPMSC